MKQMKNNEHPGLLARITHLKPRAFYFSFYSLILLLFCGCEQENVRVFSIGDSTMSNYNLEEMDEHYGGSNYPRRGWAMALPAFLNDKAEVVNRAVSGRSSKNFIAQGHWDKVLNDIQEGDFLIIQFGHNDQNADDPKRYTEAYGEYKENLLRFVKEAEALGARPIIATPIARRRFDAEGKTMDTHGDYATASIEAAKESGVPLIDLNKMTIDYLSELGDEDSKALFLHIEPGVFENLPEGLKDNTHLSKKGACAVAAMFVEGVEKSDSPLKKYHLGNKPDCYSKIK